MRTRYTERSVPGASMASMEHWLPLFSSTMEPILDYVPDAAVTLDSQAEKSRDSRFSQSPISTMRGRRSSRSRRRPTIPSTSALPPGMLFWTRAAWDDLLATRAGRDGYGIPFALAEGAGRCRCGGRGDQDFADARAKPDVNVFDALKSHIEELQKHEPALCRRRL